MNKNRRIPLQRSPYLHSLLATLLLLPAAIAAADEAAAKAIESFSLGDLMQIEVSSVARKSQTLSNTAAAAFVISQDDIRRSGATSIPEALRLAPGLEVAQIGSSRWAVTSRGFNSLYANKLLVLIDGRTVYTPLFSGVFWDLQDTMMEDIDRIEVIRGPGAAMWGANAVNGVINIITRKAKDTLGNLLVAGAGNQERGFAGFRHGGRLGDDGTYRVYGQGFSRDAAVDSGGRKENDDWQSGQVGFRIDRSVTADSRLTLQGDAYRKRVGSTTFPTTLAAPFNATIEDDDRASGGNLLARWEGSLADGSEFALQAYFDRVHFTAPALSDTEETLDIDFQHRLHPNPSNDLMWGANYRRISSSVGNTAAIAFAPDNTTYHNASAFVQDDIALVADRLRLTLGGKLEKSHFGGTQFQPNARILWTPNAQHSIWAAYSKASRTPSRGEAQSTIALGTVGGFVQVESRPNRDLSAEKVTAAEIGYRARWSSRFSTDLTAFHNRYRDLIVFTPGALDFSGFPFFLTQPMNWTNSDATTRTRGVELSADWNLLDWMRLTGAYTTLKMSTPDDPNNPDIAGLSPRNHGSLRWQMDVNANNKVDLTVRHVSALTAANQTVPAYTAFDARWAYTPRRGLEFALVGQNLNSSRHLEYRQSAALSLLTRPSEIPRSIYAKVTWAY